MPRVSSKEAANTNIQVFGLINPGVDALTSRSRGNHANEYRYEHKFSDFVKQQIGDIPVLADVI